jgi:hypothetical protein
MNTEAEESAGSHYQGVFTYRKASLRKTRAMSKKMAWGTPS